MKPRPPKELYYITHIDNVPSILGKGVLSHQTMERKNIEYTKIYNEEIVKNRRNRVVADDKKLWDFANLYFQARNPMLYRVLCDNLLENIVVLGLRKNYILERKDIFISTGNAASFYSEIFSASKIHNALPEINKNIKLDWWGTVDGGKRKIMAECLVPDIIPPNIIESIYVSSHDVANKLKNKLRDFDIPIISEPALFFQPNKKMQITQNLFLIEGDMFFSRLQTLTISVNCIGVMGKGLASRAKYLFPDVYVRYQDLCKQRKLKMGRPYLHKRETSLDYELADEPSSLVNGNAETWFLLFPTKDHWKYRADIVGIEKGLQWLQANYKESGIKSLAVPALGCGLGWLDWKDVGPLLCKYLATLDILVWIYLPAEKKISEEFISKEFLLSKIGT